MVQLPLSSAELNDGEERRHGDEVLDALLLIQSMDLGATVREQQRLVTRARRKWTSFLPLSRAERQ